MIWHLRPVSAGFWKLQQIKFHLWLKSEGNPHSDQSQGFGKIDGRRIKIEGRVWICHLLTRTMKNLTLETQGMTRLKTDWPRHLTYFSFLKGFHPVIWPNLFGVKARKESGRMQTKRVIGQFIPNGAFPWKRLCWQMLISYFSKTVPSMQTTSSSSSSNWKYCLNTEHTM